MKTWELIRTANRNLTRAKLRTFLTVMAIFVGAFTLTLTNGIGDGLRHYVETQVKHVEGNTVLFVRKKFETEDDEQAGIGKPKEYEDEIEEDGVRIDPNSVVVPIEQMQKLAAEIPQVKTVTPAYRMEAEYIAVDGGKKYRVSLGMLSEGLEQKLEAGKKFDGKNQIILPIHLARAYDENVENLVGKQVVIGYKTEADDSIQTINLTVSGVATKGMLANLNAFVDTETAKYLYTQQQGESRQYNRFVRFTFQLNSSDPEDMEAVKTTLDEKGFRAVSYEDIERRTYDGIGILQIGLNLFAFIALLAASFGIINTLIIAVMERTKDIGLKKALGMGRGKIFILFSLESVLIGFWGAAAGILGAIAVGSVANVYLANTYLESFEGYQLFVFTVPAILFVLVLVCTVAFLAGVLPATRASRLNPIEALRYE